MQPGDPRADPVVVDLIELAGLWVAAEDWSALARTLQRLVARLSQTQSFPREENFVRRFRELLELVERAGDDTVSAEEIRRTYRRATVG